MKTLKSQVSLCVLTTAIIGCSDAPLTDEQISKMSNEEVGVYVCEAFSEFVTEDANPEKLKAYLLESEYSKLVTQKNKGLPKRVQKEYSDSDCELVDMVLKEKSGMVIISYRFKSFGSRDRFKLSKEFGRYTLVDI
ncbi:hypothetical protein TUM4261_01260 [Shewanella sp. c952]|uniref:hypothetical protein n=1 Tax=Shewanella sp. c952 TaxID=2815913 RepID=UPI001BC3279E|nr:hypothetical protein [Shewanella sp. c952]GIU03506.1 hypothetical protein TUM4261_01260 [Shewanella sp. c952]